MVATLEPRLSSLDAINNRLRIFHRLVAGVSVPLPIAEQHHIPTINPVVDDGTGRVENPVRRLGATATEEHPRSCRSVVVRVDDAVAKEREGPSAVGEHPSVRIAGCESHILQ